MKTEELIRKLSSEARPARRLPVGLWMAGTALGGLLVMAVTVWLLPVAPLRPDLGDVFRRPRFWGESLLWLSTAAAVLALVYRLSLPGVGRRRDLLWALAPMVALTIAFLWRGEPKGVGADWGRELDWYRGFCGPVILWVGLVQAGLLAWVVRQAAPTRLAEAGFWIAFGAGGFGSFMMQFVCPKENFAHVVLWHVTPVLILGLAGAALGRRVLKW